MSDKKRRFFVQIGDGSNVHAGDTLTELADNLAEFLKVEDPEILEEDFSIEITSKSLTDEEVAALPEV